MPALGINGCWRTAAIVVGAVLMLATALLQMVRQATPRDLAFCLPAILACAAALWFAEPFLESIENWNLLVFFGLLIPVLVLAGTPIAFAFGISTMTYLAFMTDMPLSIVVSRMDEGMAAPVLLSIPLFIFLGLLIEMTGLAALLVNLMAALVGHLRGDSPTSWSARCTWCPAFPARKRPTWRRSRRCCCRKWSGAASRPGNDRFAFLRGGHGRNHPAEHRADHRGLGDGRLDRRPVLRRHPAGGAGGDRAAIVIFLRSRGPGASRAKRATGRQIGRAFIAAVPALALPVLIRWAVVSGVATATEVSTIGVVYTLVIALLIYRRLDSCGWGRCWSIPPLSPGLS